VSKIITYLESLTHICLFTVQTLWGYDDDEGPFNKSISNSKTILERKFLRADFTNAGEL